MDNEKKAEQGSIFQQLKSIREDKKIKLDVISAKTKIHIKYLEALENEQEGIIPDIYDSLFFKTYLSFLVTDTEEQNKYLEAFNEIRKVKKQAPPQTTIIRRLRAEKNDKRKSGIIRALYITLPLLVVAIIIIVLAVNSSNVEENDYTEQVEELSVKEIVQQMQDEKIEKEEKNIETVSDSSQKVFVSLAAIERTWLRVVSDYADTSEYMLAQNEKLALNADSVLNFLIGNAAGISFTINDSLHGVLGKSNQVITNMKINKTGIVSKKIKNISAKDTVRDTTNTN